MCHIQDHKTSKSSDAEAKALHQSRLGMTVAQYGGMAYLINYRLAKVVNNSSELGEKEVSGRLSPHGNDHIVLSTSSSRSMVSPNDTVRKEGKEVEAHPGQIMDVTRAILEPCSIA